jgi:hypothetical protein
MYRKVDLVGAVPRVTLVVIVPNVILIGQAVRETVSGKVILSMANTTGDAAGWNQKGGARPRELRSTMPSFWCTIVTDVLSYRRQARP